MESISKKCRTTTPKCDGVDSFELIYAQSVTDHYFFIVEAKDILKEKSKGKFNTKIYHAYHSKLVYDVRTISFERQRRPVDMTSCAGRFVVKPFFNQVR